MSDTTTDTFEKRLAELEVKFVFQQETIDSLNETVTKQWSIIDKLARKLEVLEGEVADLDAGPRDSKGDPPPPHY